MPARNERENLGPLFAEIDQALSDVVDFELVFIDDGSSDGTLEEALRLAAKHPRLRVIKHLGSAGKAAGLLTAARAARAELLVTIDADGQNDPADIAKMLAAWRQAPREARLGLVAGQRIRRRDTVIKRLSSRSANWIRRKLLKDGTRDTGCGLKLMPRQVFFQLPFFAGMHRFFPALISRLGLKVALVDVQDRARRAGVSKYGFWNRLWVGIGDMLTVWWLIKRGATAAAYEELTPPKEEG